MPLEGFAELDAQLAALGDAVTGKALRGAVRAGGNVVKKQAQANIPVGSRMHKTYKGRWVAPGFSKRSLRVVTKLDRNKQRASAAIGVRAEAFYAALFVELGTAKNPARPWLRPAMANTQAAQIDAMGAAMRRAILRAAKKGQRPVSRK